MAQQNTDDMCSVNLLSENHEKLMTASSSANPLETKYLPVTLAVQETSSSLENQMESNHLRNEEEQRTREQILSHVSNYSEIFSRSQQRDDPELSDVEKRKIAATLLDSSPSNFLARFGKVLEPSHLPYFHKFKSIPEVTFYLQQLEERTNLSETVVKNRRFHAMNEMIKQGEYFSMSEMRKRNPILFHQLVEKYMSPEEKKNLEQDQPKICNLSTIFMAHIDGDAICSKRKNEQQADQSTWDQASSSEEEEYDDDEEFGQEEKKFFRDEFISSK